MTSPTRSRKGGRMVVLTGRATEVDADASPADLRSLVDQMRVSSATVLPSSAEASLARLQQAMGARRCTLVTFALDGSLQKAAAEDVLELRGSMFRLRCGDRAEHPKIGTFGAQSTDQSCSSCGAPLRPDVVLPGEPAQMLSAAMEAIGGCRLLLVVGADVDDPVAQQLLAAARRADALCWQVDPSPNHALFDEVLATDPDVGLPRLVARWLNEETPR